jgi:hypothetical protein
MEKDCGDRDMDYPTEMQRKWYYILKVRDYSSGWLIAKTGYEFFANYTHPDGDRQKEWEEFQKNKELLNVF